MIVNVNNPTNRYGYKKPMDLFCSLMYLDYGIHKKLCSKEKYLSDLFVEDYAFNRNNLKEMGEIAVIFKDKKESLMDYSDYAKLFYNTGRLGLTGIIHSFMNEVFGDQNMGSDHSDYDAEIAGLTIGLIDNCGSLSYQKYNQLLKEFAEDNVDISVSPIINFVPYFNDGIEGVNHAEILIILNSLIFYTILGSLMGILKSDQINELFNYGKQIGDVEGSGIINQFMGEMDQSYKIENDKLYSLFQFCSIFNYLTTYIEKSVGIRFDDRFSKVFRAIGYEFSNIYDAQMSITDYMNLNFIITNESLALPDRMIALLREGVNPVSELYVGDHHYDYRKMYMKYLINSGLKYYPPMVELLKYPVNVDYLNIENYTSILDAHAYDRLIKELLINYNKVFDTNILIKNDSEYIESWYKLRYFERFISEIYHYWKNTKTPFKIDGVDPIYVDVETRLGSTKKQMTEITSAPYSLAYERAMYIIDSINARYCEAEDFYYCDRWKRGIDNFDSNYYSRLNDLDISDYIYDYDNPIDAVRENQYGKCPYLITIGLYNKEDLEVLALKDNIDLNKLNKLNVLDSLYVDSVRSVSRSPYEIIKNNCFNSSILEGAIGEEKSKELADILRTLTNQEFLYLSIR